MISTFPEATRVLCRAKRIQSQEINIIEKRAKTATVQAARIILKHTLLESIFSLPGLSKIQGIKNIYASLNEICNFVYNDKTTSSLMILSLFEPEIPQYVKDWFGINKQNGIIYELIGGNIGLLFKDTTTVLTFNDNNSKNTYTTQGHLVHQIYTTDANPCYKISKIHLTGKNLLENYKCSIFNRIQFQSKKVLLIRNCNSTHVSAFFKFDTQLFFTSVQIIFKLLIIVIILYYLATNLEFLIWFTHQV
jgi:hypothetical protein